MLVLVALAAGSESAFQPPGFLILAAQHLRFHLHDASAW